MVVGQRPLRRLRQQQGGRLEHAGRPHRQRGPLSSLAIFVGATAAAATPCALASALLVALACIYRYDTDVGLTSIDIASTGHLWKPPGTGTPRLPDVLLIGAQKAGSSALANWLFDCGICPARVFRGEPKFYRKEPHFFDDEQRYARGVDFYAERFARCPHDALAMDATPATMLYADQVRKTYEEWEGGVLADEVKILAVLREPSARELSWYNHVMLKCRTDRAYIHPDCYNEDGSVRSFAEYVRDVTLPHVDVGSTRRGQLCRGHYAHFLQEWFAAFRRSQILVLSYDEMVSDEGRMMQRVQSFLDLDPRANPGHMEEKNTKNNELKVRSIRCDVQERMDKVFDPLNDGLHRFLEENPGPEAEQRPFPAFVTKNCTSD